MEEWWSEEQVYASLQVPVNEEGAPLLTVLESTWSEQPKDADDKDYLLLSALLILWTTSLRLIYRLQNVQLDAALPIVTPPLDAIKFAMGLITDHHVTGALSSTLQSQNCKLLSIERLQLACMDSLLLYVHARDSLVDLLLDSQSKNRLFDVLTTNKSRLGNDKNSSIDYCAPLGLASWNLILLLEPNNQTNDRLLEQMIPALLSPLEEGNSGRDFSLSQSQGSMHKRHHKRILDLLVDWCRFHQSSNKELAHAFEQSQVIETCFTRAMNSGFEKEDESLLKIVVVLLRNAPGGIRSILLRSLQKRGDLLHRLLNHSQQFKSVQSAVLLHTLIKDRQSQITHDELSRNLWNVIDADFAKQCLDVALSIYVESKPSSHPLAVCLLDTFTIVLSNEPDLVYTLLDSMSAQSIESLVDLIQSHVINSHNSSFIDAMDHTCAAESDGSTPPAHNLSRIEHVDVSFQRSSNQNQDKALNGFRPVVAMAAATVLACLSGGHVERPDGHTLLRQGRMMEAINTYLGHLINFSSDHLPSQEMTRRRIVLVSFMTTTASLEYISTLVHTAEVSCQETLSRLQEDNARQKLAIETYKRSEKVLMREKDSLRQKLSNQSADYHRQNSLNKVSVSNHAQQLVAVHQAERQQADSRATELASQLRDLSDRLHRAEQVAEASRQAEVEAKNELEQLLVKLRQLESDEKHASQQAELNAKKVVDLSKELQAARTAIDHLVQNEKEMKEEIRSQSEAMVQLEKSEAGMQESLENLFADLVNVSKLFELKEREQSSAQKRAEVTVSKLTKKLESEQARYAELQERNRQTSCENEQLSRKYAHTREKLEKERDERNKDRGTTSRHGKENYRSTNASYFSHLDRNNKTSRATGRPTGYS
jgi:hypothetical protein